MKETIVINISIFQDQALSIIFLITKHPACGEIQYLANEQNQYQGDDKNQYQVNEHNWVKTDNFTEEQIGNGKIRYFHTGSKKDIGDEFSFVLSSMKETQTENHIFSINFVMVTLEIVRNAELRMDSINEIFIAEGDLYTVTHPKPSLRSAIIYQLIAQPQFGELHLSTSDFSYQTMLTVSSNFTQDDITKGRLKYKLTYVTLSNFLDEFEFEVNDDYGGSKRGKFRINYKSPPFDGKIINQSVLVREGAIQNINSTNLRVVSSGFTKISYTISEQPKHGTILILNQSSKQLVRSSATFFSDRELNSGQVFYKHDDSENFRDQFRYIALTEDARPNFQIIGYLKI